MNVDEALRGAGAFLPDLGCVRGHTIVLVA